jgi:hypothetical protein
MNFLGAFVRINRDLAPVLPAGVFADAAITVYRATINPVHQMPRGGTGGLECLDRDGDNQRLRDGGIFRGWA